MGQAFDRDGNVLGAAEGPTRRDVLEKLERMHPDAAEVRIHSMREQAPSERAGRMMDVDMGPTTQTIAERLSLQNVEQAFTYQPWGRAQNEAGEQVREALIAAAKVILRVVPDGPLRTRALNDLIDARMKANAAITFCGRF